MRIVFRAPFAASMCALMMGAGTFAGQAADLAVPAGFVWTGGYFGLQAGGGWSKVDQPYGFDASDPNEFFQANANGSGAVGGVHAGYNWQAGSFVIGGEADIDATSIDGDDGGSGGDINGFKAKWMASVRARVGYAVDRWLVYGTGGYAYLSASADTRNVGRKESHSASFNGWTAGAGVEYALTDHVTISGEYRFADFGSKVVTFNNYVEDISPQINTIRVGISYKF
jgi:outer membrane immunogenic protein